MKIGTSLPGGDREAGRRWTSLAMTGLEMAIQGTCGEGFFHKPCDKQF